MVLGQQPYNDNAHFGIDDRLDLVRVIQHLDCGAPNGTETNLMQALQDTMRQVDEEDVGRRKRVVVVSEQLRGLAGGGV